VPHAQRHSLAVLSPGLVVVATGAGLAVAAAAFVVDPRLGLVALGLPLALLAVASPVVALTFLLFVLPLEELSALTPDGVVTITKLLGVGAVGAWILHTLVARRPVSLPRIMLPLAAFLCWAAVSALWAVDPSASVRVAATLIQLLALYVLVANLLTRPEALRMALGAHVAGAVVLAVLALHLMEEGVLQRGRVAIVVDRQLLVESNALAAGLLFPVGICIAWALDRARPVLERLALALAGTLCATTLLVTLSRGAIAALVAMLVTASVARRALWLPVLGIVLALPGLLLVGGDLWERIAAAAALADRGAGRLDIWQVGMLVIGANPLAGVGLGCFPIVYFDYLAEAGGVSWKHAAGVARSLARYPHNTYLGVTAELGLVGLLLFTSALVVHLRSAVTNFRALRARRPSDGTFALAALLGLIGFGVLAFGFDIAQRKYFWLVLGLVAAGSALRGRDSSPAERRGRAVPLGPARS
jgi:O-antigen ligase